MSDTDLDHLMQTIRDRRLFLNRMYSKPSRVNESAGLISANKLIYLLASRYLIDLDVPFHDINDEVRLVWEFSWYDGLLEATIQILEVMRDSLAAGDLVLREPLSRAPLSRSKLQAWLDRDVIGEIAAAQKEFLENAEARKEVFAIRWPEVVGGVIGHVYLDEFCTWAESLRIASPGEIDALLNQEPAPQDAEEREKHWIKAARAYADEICQSHRGSIQLSKNALAPLVAKRLSLEGVKGRANRAISTESVRRHALLGWEPPLGS